MRELKCQTGVTTADCIDDDYSYMCAFPYVFQFGSMFTRLDHQFPTDSPPTS